MCDKILIRKYNFILPISEFLIGKIKNRGTPYLKFPILAKFPEVPTSKNSDLNLLYCASVTYWHPLYLIINCFEILKEKCSCNLNLVLNGKDEEINEVRLYVKKKNMNNCVFIYTKLPAYELERMYSYATILLIPLIPNYIPDIARFSQKIAEYLVTGNPVVSTNVGEICYYFKDKENIFLCEYDAKAFADTCYSIITDLDAAQKVGFNGFKIGKQFFDVRNISKELGNFLENLQ